MNVAHVGARSKRLIRTGGWHVPSFMTPWWPEISGDDVLVDPFGDYLFFGADDGRSAHDVSGSLPHGSTVLVESGALAQVDESDVLRCYQAANAPRTEIDLTGQTLAITSGPMAGFAGVCRRTDRFASGVRHHVLAVEILGRAVEIQADPECVEAI